MLRSSAVWVVFALLGIVFFGVSVALFAQAGSRPFGFVTLVCAVVVLVSAWVGHRRSRLRR
ncbi:hypothetical protein DEJ30_03580 [Curtobacterium sp. MCPF17_003]|uniref:hypothetical protein n=1 Tax=unclassified Curtobacterium TaxID=257496 RepID=UPI000D92F9A4|nr:MULTISPECIES: hypothetical protein [unclassified Curtobacterium]PYY65394.1 hypothetical protein DEJ30_03580 [Curtobacterium sp. MCPF17_003]PZE71415.1 hypothetical protein DEJ27_05570 [Curtobacterium sp. MCPF17_018]PZF32493.1 hypothetical protein DEJ35_04370 [Curtobacterium sp. MCPF17_051]